MQEGYRFNYGKRSADAEPEAEADAEPKAEADAWYGPYSHWNMNNNWMSYNNMYNNMNYMNNNMYNNMNYMNRPSYSQYHKRSADAEADAFYGPYSYSSFGYNWPMNYMNRPYYHYSSYRYHF